MKIDQSNIAELVTVTWTAVKTKVENGYKLSSEKTLVFLFAMELVNRVGNDLKIDFENQCYDDLAGRSKYLDLLFYTDDDFKVAIEFKLPKRNGNANSNQTETRQFIYRDLARLKYLRTSPLNPQACYFLMAVNEAAYLNNGNYKVGPNFITAHNHIIRNDNNVMAEGISLDGISAQFIWDNIVQANNGRHTIEQGRFAWLTPISI